MKDDLTKKVNSELEQLQNKMRSTIQAEEERGASLQHLEKQTGELEERTHVFEEHARQTNWKMWIKAVKWYVLAAVVVVVILIGIFRK